MRYTVVHTLYVERSQLGCRNVIRVSSTAVELEDGELTLGRNAGLAIT